MSKLTEIAKVKRDSRNQKNDFKLNLSEFKTIEAIKGSWQMRQYITPATDRKVLTVPQLKQAILAIYDKRKAKQLTEDLSMVESIFNAGSIREIKISIEWKKNRTWGSNPTAEVRIFGDNFEYFSSGSIGGCGFDKESTAFANAINNSLAFRKLLLSGAKKISKDYGHRNGSLSGGVGTPCYYSIFENLGYKMTCTGSGKMFDVYHIVKK